MKTDTLLSNPTVPTLSVGFVADTGSRAGVRTNSLPPIFEEKTRWPGAPRTCIAENLGAFETRKELDNFLRENAPSCKVRKIWQCDHCKCFHVDATARSKES